MVPCFHSLLAKTLNTSLLAILMSHSLVSVVSKHCIHEQKGSGLLVVSGPAIGASLEREERARVRLTQFDFGLAP